MIIENVLITNFGLFKGTTSIDLSPAVADKKNIIVISGKNGVGKSTIQEAIHLCLLGSLAIDNRISEANYEHHLISKSYRNAGEQSCNTSISLLFNFVKSGISVQYNVTRSWNNEISNLNEQLLIMENERELTELSKKEKNLFLRELIQPGFAKIMFFDGEQLSLLFESSNLSRFIEESCNDLFGLNFIELLKLDLNYLTNKLLSQQANHKNIDELKKVEIELADIEDMLQEYFAEKEIFENQLSLLRQSVLLQEDEINKQGRWMTKKLDKIKIEKQIVETTIQSLKKEVGELYGNLGPFVFCRSLCVEVKNRLLIEREIEKWFHAKELLNSKAVDIENTLSNTTLLTELFLTKKAASKLLGVIKKTLLSKPSSFLGEETIHHNVSDTERTKIINWIDLIITHVSKQLKEKTEYIINSEEKLKSLNKEQATFSKDDIVQPLIKQLQELNKKIGATEQKYDTLIKKINEQLKRKEYYNNLSSSIQERLMQGQEINSKLHLTHKTKLALDDYSKELLTKKLQLLEEGVVSKFNLLCRKDDYIDSVTIDPINFNITLKITNVITEHRQLSAGEKQLFILSLLWSMRELTNIKLPLIIDTPLARLDQEHRLAFISEFLPAIEPQAILIGTDTEVMDELLEPVYDKIAQHYHLTYDHKTVSNKLYSKENLDNQKIA